MSIEKTDLVTAFGDYYIDEGQDMKRLLSDIRQPSVTPSHAKPIIYDGEVYRFSNVILDSIVQQFQKAFTPKGDVEFQPNEIRLRNLKVDLSLYPDDVKGSWLGFLGSIKDDERKNWPLVRYVLEKHVIPQMKEDMELNAYYKGAWVAPTVGTAGSAGAAFDGIKGKLTAGIGDTSMNEVTLSAAVTASNAFDMVEEFADSFDSKLDGVKTTIYMDPTILKWYRRDKRNTHGQDVNYKPTEIEMVDFTNKKLVALPSMAGEKTLWGTPDDNFLYLRRVNGMNKPKVEEAKREVALMLDWWEALGFGYNKLVNVANWV